MSSRLTYALLGYAALWLLWFARIDDLDRRSALWTALSLPQIARASPRPWTWPKMALRVLSLPLRPASYYSRMSEGASYTADLYVRDPRLARQFGSKLFWQRTLVAAGLPHPTLYAYRSASGRVVVVKRMQRRGLYVLKPVYGGFGRGVRLVTGAEAMRALASSRREVLVQQYLAECDPGRPPRHFRCVTLVDSPRAFSVSELRAKSPHHLASDLDAGASARICPLGRCASLTVAEQRELDGVIRRLARLHRRRFPGLFAVAWDVMLHCRGGRAAAHVLEANDFGGVWAHPHTSLEAERRGMIREFKRRLRLFHGQRA